jgi:hypothetical protein
MNMAKKALLICTIGALLISQAGASTSTTEATLSRAAGYSKI